MAKSNELRKLITEKLNDIKTANGIKGIYFQLAQDNTMFPHVVYSFDRFSTMADDLNRRDITLIIDIFDRGNSAVAVNNIADAVEELLDQQNLPQTNILPTFYLEGRRDLPDEDKLIRHIQLEFTIQNFERN